MTTVLDTTDYLSIRSLVNATTDDLSDNDLGYYGVVPFVNALMARVIPDYSVLSSTDQTWAKIAGNYYAAVLCVPILQVRFGETSSFKLGEYEEKYQNPKWEDIEKEYLMRARTAILSLSTMASLISNRRVLFTATGPTSSGASWPMLFDQFYYKIRPKVLVWANSGGFLQFSWYNNGGGVF